MNALNWLLSKLKKKKTLLIYWNVVTQLSKKELTFSPKQSLLFLSIFGMD